VNPLPDSASDADLLSFIDGWAALMEHEDYTGALGYTEHAPEMDWTPSLLREVVKAYGEARPDQKVTLAGIPSDVSQRKEVTRWRENGFGEVGEIWYDLNIDGVASDLTATFAIVRAAEGLFIRLNDIHVM
jgi:hypothetical protein